MTEQSAVRLDRYLDRIGYRGRTDPDVETLCGVHLAHATTIPFENLDIQLDRPIRLDLDSLQAKLVDGNRGGYCFEQNGLFSAVLETMGFSVTRLAARVRMGRSSEDPLPRNHMLMLVHLDAPWVADVGFGGDGLLEPIPLQPGAVAEQFGRRFRLVEEGPNLVLQSFGQEGWLDMYEFTMEPQLPVDYEPANYWTSTYPRSGFVLHVTVQRQTREAQLTLRDRTLTETRGGRVVAEEVVEDDDRLLEVLRERFGLTLPPGTRFRCLVQQPPQPAASGARA